MCACGWSHGRTIGNRRGEKADFDVPRIALPKTRKHSAGYRLEPGMDAVDLFIGSEGTLGVVTEAELQLLPAPGEILGGVVFFPTEEAALDAVDRWRPTPGLRMLEFLDSRSIKLMELPYGAAVLVEIEGDAELNMGGALEDESWFGSSAADRERFRSFRHRLPERIHERLRRGGFVVLATDYAVPLERSRDILAIYRKVLSENFGDKFVMFGHIGDAMFTPKFFRKPIRNGRGHGDRGSTKEVAPWADYAPSMDQRHLCRFIVIGYRGHATVKRRLTLRVCRAESVRLKRTQRALLTVNHDTAAVQTAVLEVLSSVSHLLS
jgi:hypothetical protein